MADRDGPLPAQHLGFGDMVERTHLRLVGFAYGAVTATIMVVALLVVTAHVGTQVEAHRDPVLVSAK